MAPVDTPNEESDMQLAITLLGENQPSLIVEVTRAIKDAHCATLESRITQLGTRLAGHLLVEGNWNHIARLEPALETLAARHELKLHHQRLPDSESPAVETDEALPYAIDVFAADQLSNINDLCEFMSLRGIAILDLSTSHQSAPYTGAPLFLAHLIVKIPAGMRIVSLRDEFLDFCDQLNLDAILEPVKR
jgi:glycine cleavage system transcriptional repressor